MQFLFTISSQIYNQCMLILGKKEKEEKWTQNLNNQLPYYPKLTTLNYFV